MKHHINNLKRKAQSTAANIQTVLTTRRGEAYIDTGVKILIAVVLGALLLTTLYTLFNTNLLTNVSSAITNLFNYEGAVGGLGG